MSLNSSEVSKLFPAQKLYQSTEDEMRGLFTSSSGADCCCDLSLQEAQSPPTILEDFGSIQERVSLARRL